MREDNNSNNSVGEKTGRKLTERLESGESLEGIERRFAELESRLERLETADDGANEPSDGVSRRGVMGATGALGLAGLLGASSRSGAADPSGSVGSDDRPVDVHAHNLTVEGGITFPDEWGSRDDYGPETPSGGYHSSPAGLVIDPEEPIRLEEATVDADSAGTLVVELYTLVAGDGGVGYPDSPLTRYTFDVESGENVLSFDLRLDPIPDEFEGYHFYIDDGDVELRRDTDVSTPIDIGIATLSGWSASSGSQFDNYYHFFDLSISADRTDQAVYQRGEEVRTDPAALNGYHFLTEPIEDWGAALNEKIETARAGDVIVVPNGSYVSETTAVVDKPLAIVGWGANGNLRDPTGPRIVPTGSHPLVETAADTAVRVSGLNFVGENVTTGEGIICHGRCAIDTITADQLDSDVVLLHQESADDNLNNSRVQGVSGRSVDGAVVKTQNTSGTARELNALEISVQLSFSNDYGINADDGFGNWYHVQQLEGSHEAGLRMNTQRSLGSVTYAEANVAPVIEFQDAQNTGFVNHAGPALSYEDLFNFAHSNNMGIQIGRQSDPFITRPYGTIDFGGGSIETRKPGYGVIMTTPDGSSRYRLQIDNDGNIETEEL